MASGARRAWRGVAGYLAAAPGSHVLLLIVTVTTLVLRGVDASTATQVLRQQSTNLFHMSTDAPRVLVLSAFLLDQGQLWKVFLVFTAVLVPLERWIGTYRWIVVFASGHIGATLATTVGIWMQVRTGVGGRELTYVVDVGVSYGLAAAAGVLVFRLPRPLSWVLGIGLVTAYTVAVARTGTFTDWGHLCALLIGLALAPLVRPHADGAGAGDGALVRHAGARGWLRWLATPPPPAPPHRRRRIARVAGVALACVAVASIVVILTTNPDVDLRRSPDARTATVIGPSSGCHHPCGDVIVRLGATTAVLRLKPGTDAHAGSRIVVRPVVREPGTVRLVAISRRVHGSGLLGETALVSGAAGLVLLAAVGRPRRDAPVVVPDDEV
jgi:hypothetical protein